MVLGQDERLARRRADDFQRSGLAHLLAVSGQNVMLLAILVLAVAARVGLALRARLRRWRSRWSRSYVPLAGGGPSIQRAGVMGAAGLVAALAGRPASRWYALGLAAAVDARAEPARGRRAGLAALVRRGGRAAGARAPLRGGARRARMPGPVAEAAAITIAATLGTAPLLALHFEQVSLAVAARQPARRARGGADHVARHARPRPRRRCAPALAAPLNALGGPLLAYVAWLAHAAGAARRGRGRRRGSARRPAVASPTPAPARASSLARAAWRRCERGRACGARGAGRGSAVLAAARGASRPSRSSRGRTRRGLPPPAPGELVVSFLDVGQGDATLLQRGGGASVLFDTGPPGRAGGRSGCGAPACGGSTRSSSPTRRRDHEGRRCR